MKSSGTWIDWQYLLKAAELLMKVCVCRKLRMHVYVYAVSMGLQRQARNYIFMFYVANG